MSRTRAVWGWIALAMLAAALAARGDLKTGNVTATNAVQGLTITGSNVAAQASLRLGATTITNWLDLTFIVTNATGTTATFHAVNATNSMTLNGVAITSWASLTNALASLAAMQHATNEVYNLCARTNDSRQVEQTGNWYFTGNSTEYANRELYLRSGAHLIVDPDALIYFGTLAGPAFMRYEAIADGLYGIDVGGWGGWATNGVLYQKGGPLDMRGNIATNCATMVDTNLNGVIGHRAMVLAGGCAYNGVSGYLAMYGATNCNYNGVSGSSAMYGATNCDYNGVSGSYAMRAAKNCDGNGAVGYYALQAATNATYSGALGSWAGKNATGAGRIYVDSFASDPGPAYDPTNSAVYVDNGTTYIGRPDKTLYLRGTVVGGGGGSTNGLAPTAWVQGATQAVYTASKAYTDGATNGNLRGEQITSGTVADARIASTVARDSEVAAATNALGTAAHRTVGHALASLRPVQAPVTITYTGTNVVTDASLGTRFRVTVTNNCRLANPTNTVDGEVYSWWIKQGTGTNRVFYAAADWVLPVGANYMTNSTAINAVDVFGAQYDSVVGKMRVTTFMRYSQ